MASSITDRSNNRYYTATLIETDKFLASLDWIAGEPNSQSDASVALPQTFGVLRKAAASRCSDDKLDRSETLYELAMPRSHRCHSGGKRMPTPSAHSSWLRCATSVSA